MFLYRHWLFMAAFIFTPQVFGVFISNLSESCGRCLCEAATGCNVTLGCFGGYCGPFHVARVYWVDAGRVILPDDDILRKEAYEDCANDYHCGLRIVTGYLAKYAKDCNADDVVDCMDYAMIHYNGGYVCEKPIVNSRFYKRYIDCSQDICGA